MAEALNKVSLVGPCLPCSCCFLHAVFFSLFFVCSTLFLFLYCLKQKQRRSFVNLLMAKPVPYQFLFILLFGMTCAELLNPIHVDKAYVLEALEKMAKKNNGRITCPRTSLVCNYTELFKTYIL